MSTSLFFHSHTAKRLFVGLLLEFGPILIFLASFERYHVFKATSLLMIATIVSTIVTYRLQKRIPYVALYVALITIAFGYLTLMHREPKFIQMRDTLYDLTCAFTLLVGLMVNVPVLKIAFHDIIPMAMRAWHRLTYAWIGYFFMIALLNEYVRRHFTLEEWFFFKSVMVVVTAVFGFTVLYFYYEKETKPSRKVEKGEVV